MIPLLADHSRPTMSCKRGYVTPTNRAAETVPMADADIPKSIPHGIRVLVFTGAIPFIGLLEAFDRYFARSMFEAAGCVAISLASIVVATYWERLLPRKWRPLVIQRYVPNNAELSDAIRRMSLQSAWGRWWAAQQLVNRGKRIENRDLLNAAAREVREKIIEGAITIRGRRPGAIDYHEIPADHWRSSDLYWVPDPISLSRLKIIPMGTVTWAPDGTMTSHDPTATARTAEVTGYDSYLVNSLQFEGLWPSREAVADKGRRRFLRQARKQRLDKDEINRLS
jgi:hypothetical protein